MLGFAAVLLFATLDAHYLRPERVFRALYRGVVAGRVSFYDMSNSRYYGKRSGDIDVDREDGCRWRQVILSWAIGGFYGPILLLGLLITYFANC